jgi:hypothetical protein
MIDALLALIVLAGAGLLCGAVDLAAWIATPIRPRHPLTVAAAVLGLLGLGGVGGLFVVVGLAGMVGPVG